MPADPTEPSSADDPESELADDCAPVTPAELPNGDEPGQLETTEGGVAWGGGDNRVTQVSGSAALQIAGDDGFDPATWQPEQTVVADGVERFTIPVGDYGLSEVQIRFVLDGCDYINFLPAGTSEADAISYAERF